MHQTSYHSLILVLLPTTNLVLALKVPHPLLIAFHKPIPFPSLPIDSTILLALPLTFPPWSWPKGIITPKQISSTIIQEKLY